MAKYGKHDGIRFECPTCKGNWVEPAANFPSKEKYQPINIDCVKCDDGVAEAVETISPGDGILTGAIPTSPREPRTHRRSEGAIPFKSVRVPNSEIVEDHDPYHSSLHIDSAIDFARRDKYDRGEISAKPPDHDPVNHPKHYTEHPSGVECIQITEHMGFCLGNAMKYIWRADLKNGVEDLRKAKWYIEREIAKRDGE